MVDEKVAAVIGERDAAWREIAGLRAEVESLRQQVGRPQPCAACGTSKDDTQFCYAHDWMRP